MDSYLERLVQQQEQKSLENRAIEAELAAQGYARTWDASPTMLKWAAILFLGLCIGVFLGAGALLAAIILFGIIWFR